MAEHFPGMEVIVVRFYVRAPRINNIKGDNIMVFVARAYFTKDKANFIETDDLKSEYTTIFSQVSLTEVGDILIQQAVTNGWIENYSRHSRDTSSNSLVFEYFSKTESGREAFLESLQSQITLLLRIAKDNFWKITFENDTVDTPTDTETIFVNFK